MWVPDNSLENGWLSGKVSAVGEQLEQPGDAVLIIATNSLPGRPHQELLLFNVRHCLSTS